MLNISCFTSGYGDIEVLHKLDLNINAGEIVALIGPNGAGKSTVLKSIFRLADVYSGRILFQKKNITDMKTHELIRLGISFVPQGRQVFTNMTVLENLQMGAFMINDRNAVKGKIHDVYKRFPVLKEKQAEYAAHLSGGQQQLLAIARALMQNPKLLLLDEPSLGLSPKIVKEVFEKILEIQREGVAILIVEQNVKQAVGIADRTCVLENGRIVLEGGKEILKNTAIKDIYFGGDIALQST